MSKTKKLVLEIERDTEKGILYLKCPFCSSLFSVNKKQLEEILNKGKYIRGKI